MLSTFCIVSLTGPVSLQFNWCHRSVHTCLPTPGTKVLDPRLAVPTESIISNYLKTLHKPTTVSSVEKGSYILFGSYNGSYVGKMSASDKEALSLEDMEKGEKTEKQSKSLLCSNFCKENLLIILLLISLILGIALGFIIKIGADMSFTDKEIAYISFPGTIFLNSLKMVIIPLIVSSLIAGMASLDKQASGKLGGKAILYYMTTTFIAVILGIIMVTSIRPGKGTNKDEIIRDGTSQQVNTVDAFLDLIRQVFLIITLNLYLTILIV